MKTFEPEPGSDTLTTDEAIAKYNLDPKMFYGRLARNDPAPPLFDPLIQGFDGKVYRVRDDWRLRRLAVAASESQCKRWSKRSR